MSVLSWDISEYTPRSLRDYTSKELRSEYARLRSVAQKRLSRLAAKGYEETNVYRYNVGKYEPTRALSDAQIRYRLSQLADFIESPVTTITGIKASHDRMIETMRKRGFTGINQSNIAQFGRFMEAYRASNLDKIYDSKRVAAIFSSAESGLSGVGDRFLRNAIMSFAQDQGFSDLYDAVK